MDATLHDMAPREESPPRTQREEHYETQRASSSSESKRSPPRHRTATGDVSVPDLIHKYEHGNESKATISTGSDSSTVRRASRQKSSLTLGSQRSSNTLRSASNARLGSRWPNRERSSAKTTIITKTGSPKPRMYRPRAPGPLSSNATPSSRLANFDSVAGQPPVIDQHDLFRQASVEEIKEANKQRTRLPQHVVTAAIGNKSNKQQPSYASIQSNAFDIPRPPPPPRVSASTLHLSSIYQEHEDSLEEQLEAARREQSSSLERHPSYERQRHQSHLATELYTISYLIFFSFWGVLARLGVQWLTFYPGAPATISVLWANIGGSLIFGFLSEDRKLFREEWGDTPGFTNSFESSKTQRRSRSQTQSQSEKRRPSDRGTPPNDNSEERLDDPQAEDSASDRNEDPTPETLQNHAKVKKSIPLYIGLATGFCGSFTSFSSFMRDCFLAISNDLPSPINHPYPSGAALPSTTVTVTRNGGYSFEALIAILLMTIGLSLAALKLGRHLALALDRFTPILSFKSLRHTFDRVMVFLAFGCWLGAILLAALPPDRNRGTEETWRGEVLFAVVFAPIGCLARFYVSRYLNPISSNFPLGTFAVNIFGTAVEAMCFDIQHVAIDSTALGSIGGGVVSCQVLQGIMDGFCGCLTTISTWVGELEGLKRKGAYRYGSASVLAGLGVVIVVMGSVRWSVGFAEAACVT